MKENIVSFWETKLRISCFSGSCYYSEVKLYAEAQRKIALGLEFKCSIASSVHSEPHSPFSFHPTLLSGNLLWKYSLSFWVFCIRNPLCKYYVLVLLDLSAYMHQIRATFSGKLVNYITKTGRFVLNITCSHMSYGLSD